MPYPLLELYIVHTSCILQPEHPKGVADEVNVITLGSTAAFQMGKRAIP